MKSPFYTMLPTSRASRLALLAGATALFLGSQVLHGQGAAPADQPSPAAPPAAEAGNVAPAGPRGRGGGQGGNAGVPAEADFSPRPAIVPKTPAEEAKTFLLPPGYRMELIASEPEVSQPVLIEFDGNGRMYVAEMLTYTLDTLATSQYEPRSRITRWESSKGDGVYDKHTVFIDHLVLPRAILPLDNNRILINETRSDNFELITDSNGDGVADKREAFFTGVGSGGDGNVEHQQSGFIWALDNWIYSTYNTFRFRWTPGGVLREPIPSGGGQWGMTQDDDGKIWMVNASAERGPVSFQIPVQYGSRDVADSMEPGFLTVWPAVGLYDFQGGMQRARVPAGTLNVTTAAAGVDVFRGTALPGDLRGDLLFADPVGRLIRRAKIVKSEGLTQLRNAYPGSEFVLSTDPLFRPINLRTGPDGAAYIVDMYRGIIQEANWSRPGTYLHAGIEQHGLEKITGGGRIWRLRYDGIPAHTTDVTVAAKPGIPLNPEQPKMLDESAAQLVSHLGNPNGWWRDTAKRLLILKQDKSVVPELEKMVRMPDNLLGRFHALWTLEGLGSMSAALVREQLKDSNPRMRVQAIRASETLYKAGDRSFAADYLALVNDTDADVSIQALLTGNVLKLPDFAAVAKGVLPKEGTDEKKPRGVVEFATWISNGASSGRGGGPAVAARTPEQQELLNKGAQTFSTLCFACHGTDGRGTPVPDAPGTIMAPALAGSARTQGHRDYVIKLLLNGLTGPVDGKTYTGEMIPMEAMTDDTLAGVASYVRNSFGNSAGFVTAADVARVRAAKTRTTRWTVAELTDSLPVLLPTQPTWNFSVSTPSPAANANPRNVVNLTGYTLPASESQWLQIELPVSTKLTEIQFNLGGGGRGGGRGGGGRGGTPAAATNAAPAEAAVLAAQGRQFKIQVSQDGAAWTGIESQSRSEGALNIIAFSPTAAKFVRILSNSNTPTPGAWAITNLRLYQSPN